MKLSKLQLCLYGLVLVWIVGPPAAAEAGEKQAVNLRDSPAKATNLYNAKVVEEFRANSGRVGGTSQLLLLHTTGAKTGLPRLTPLAYLENGQRIVVIA